MDLMKFFDLFSGIGGFRMALESEGYKAVGYCEIDKHARKLYELIYDTHGEVKYEDAKEIVPERLPDFDVLTAGFPCQAFSVAGKRGGFNNTRGTLFFEITRIARVKKPTYLLLENVKGLLSHDKGRTFATILLTLDEMGYDAEWEVLNSKWFGIPQNRERVFIVGHLRGRSRPKIFPILGEDKVYYRSDQAEERISDASSVVNESSEWIFDHQGRKSKWNNPKLLDYCPTLRAQPHGNVPTVVKTNGVASTLLARQYANWNGNYVVEPTAVRACLTPERKEKRQNGRRYKEPDEPMFTLTAQDRYGVILETPDDIKIRKLTPLECFRLQGFPDRVVAIAQEHMISDTQLYKMAGNSVTVQVVQTIARKMKRLHEEQ